MTICAEALDRGWRTPSSEAPSCTSQTYAIWKPCDERSTQAVPRWSCTSRRRWMCVGLSRTLAFDAQVNVAGTVSVMEAAREVGANRVLLASTAATYGEPEMIPTSEDIPTAPLSPYGTSKAAAEWYLAQYSRLHGMSTLALRMSNVYGPRQDPDREAGVVAIFAGAAIAGRPVTVFGDGCQTRDYVYVGDVVSAWLAAAELRRHGGTQHLERYRADHSEPGPRARARARVRTRPVRRDHPLVSRPVSRCSCPRLESPDSG